MSVHRLRCLGRSLWLSCALLGANAIAGVDHYVQVDIDARGGNLTQRVDSGPVNGPSVTVGPLGFDVFTPTSHYGSSIAGTATYGHLTGKASAFQINAPNSFAVQSDASTDFGVRFLDTITLQAANLAPGTFVTLSMTMDYHDDLMADTPTCCSNTDVQGIASLGGFQLGHQAQPGQHLVHHQIVGHNLNWAIGQANTIGAFLVFDAGSSPGCCNGPMIGGSSVNLIDATFQLTLPPGVSAIAASGHDYTAAVPEPASAGLLLAGALALAARRRWRQRRRA